ncbi:MAG: hypothetical protein LW817_03900 [Candidatus Caenarcaniphilales bacterium]|nr:hypothetical protein [Candidatus Caenarcaniphilales bacterium]
MARAINTHISQEEQVLIWKVLSKNIRLKAIKEQKIKYGTKAFEHDQMPRIITEKTRAAYKQAIMANQKFQEAGFSFLGMGFGGAAFKVNDSFGKNSIAPNYVLKVCAAAPSASDNKLFAPLNIEYQELEKLTKFSQEYSAQQKQNEHFSQTLAGIVDGEQHWQYIGFNDPNNPKGSVLATIYQPGKNIYENALCDLQWRRECISNLHCQDEERLNPYLLNGITDKELKDLIKYYLALADKEISFYDLFLHNMHYVEEDKSLRFVDSFANSRPIHQSIKEARKKFPLDTCIFDLVTFLVLQEQSHPYAVTVRSDERATLAALHQCSLADKKKLAEKPFLANLDKKLEQIIRCLDALARENVLDKNSLRQSIERLISFNEYSAYYEPYYNSALKKDFDRITPRGKRFLLEIAKRFKVLSANGNP